MRKLVLSALFAVAALFSADSGFSPASAQGFYVRGNPNVGYIAPRNRVMISPDGYAVSRQEMYAREAAMAPCGRDYYGRPVPCSPPPRYHGHGHHHGCGSVGGAVAGAVIGGVAGGILGGAIGGSNQAAGMAAAGGAAIGGIAGSRSGC